MKNIFSLSLIFLLPFTVNAQKISVSIDLQKLEGRDGLLLIEGGSQYDIPSDGIVNINADNLPTLIRFVVHEKRKILTKKYVWIETKELTVSGSISADNYKIIPQLSEQKIADGFSSGKEMDLNSPNLGEKSHLVFLLTSLNFHSNDYLNSVLSKVPEQDHTFWAFKAISNYLLAIQAVKFNPSTGILDGFVARNKENMDQEFKQDRSKMLLMDFSATSCYYCLKDIDELKDLYNSYNEHIEFLTIWDDKSHDVWVNTAKSQKDKIDWTSLRDDKGVIHKAFDINILPTYIFFDTNGKVIKRIQGVKKVKSYLDKQF